MSGTLTACKWCRMQYPVEAGACPRCGAAVDVSLVTNAAGWTEQPPIADMAQLQLGRSRAQIEGMQVPVVDMTLAEGDGVYCSHDKLLWHEGKVRLSNKKGGGIFKRMRAGMPLVMLQVDGPGRIAFSHNLPGELLAVPLNAGTRVMAREHHMLLATNNVDFEGHQAMVSYRTSSGNESETHYPMGMYVDEFHTLDDQPGCVLLHAAGNVFTKHLAAGQSVDVSPHSVLAWISQTRLELLIERTPTGMGIGGGIGGGLGGLLSMGSYNYKHYLSMRIHGPGRVWIQSGTHGHTEEWRPIDRYLNAVIRDI